MRIKCLFCNKNFAIQGEKYCSERCRLNYNAKVYREKHRDKVNASVRKYHQEHREEINAKDRKYPLNKINTCTYCKKPFKPDKYHPLTKVCKSPECQRLKLNENKRIYDARHREAINARARKFPANKVNICIICKKEFHPRPNTPYQKCCSKECRSKYHNRKYPKPKHQKRCKNCHKIFFPERYKLLAYCKVECRDEFLEKQHPLRKKCKFCGKDIIRVKGFKKDYCDLTCRHKANYEKCRIAENRVKLEGTLRKCPTCKKLFELQAINQIFCSKQCQKPKMITCKRCGKKRKNNYKGMCINCRRIEVRAQRNPKVTRICEYCGKHFSTKKLLPRKHCSQRCKERAYRKFSPTYKKRISTKKFKQQSNERVKKFMKKHPIRYKRFTKKYAMTERSKNIKKISGWNRRRKKRGFHPCYTKMQLKEIIKRDKVCVYCHKKQKRMTIDHLVPILRGGVDENNVAYACGSCNFRKHSKTVKEFLQTDYCQENSITYWNIAPIVRKLLRLQKKKSAGA